jgi:hypothetical protein
MDVLFFVWEPLACQAWPVEGMGDNQVVEVWRVLFPKSAYSKPVVGIDSTYAYHVLYS